MQHMAFEAIGYSSDNNNGFDDTYIAVIDSNIVVTAEQMGDANNVFL